MGSPMKQEWWRNYHCLKSAVLIGSHLFHNYIRKKWHQHLLFCLSRFYSMFFFSFFVFRSSTMSFPKWSRYSESSRPTRNTYAYTCSIGVLSIQHAFLSPTPHTQKIVRVSMVCRGGHQSLIFSCSACDNLFTWHRMFIKKHIMTIAQAILMILV